MRGDTVFKACSERRKRAGLTSREALLDTARKPPGALCAVLVQGAHFQSGVACRQPDRSTRVLLWYNCDDCNSLLAKSNGRGGYLQTKELGMASLELQEHKLLRSSLSWRGRETEMIKREGRCQNFNHRRANAPVRFCPMCGEAVNEEIPTMMCAEQKHAESRRNRNKYCANCGEQLIKNR